MTPRAIHYGFTQNFNVPAHKAFSWCTDFRPDDMALMQKENASRKIQRLADDVIILVDTLVNEGKSVEKRKLVCLYPSRLTWTSTHLTGPNRYSQFVYEITPQIADKSELKFTAMSLDYQVRDNDDLERRGEELKKMDSETWKLLAEEMEKDLNPKIK